MSEIPSQNDEEDEMAKQAAMAQSKYGKLKKKKALKESKVNINRGSMILQLMKWKNKKIKW